jgi:hypothetical protein
VKAHPLSEVFPMLEGAEFDDFVADIEANGLQEPVVLLDGMILDGRNRWAACKRLKMKQVPTIPYEGKDPAKFVISANIRRRHLSTSQRAMIAAEIARSQICGSNQTDAKTSAQAEQAENLKVSERSVHAADKVIEQGTAKDVEAVKSGQKTVSKAEKEIRDKEKDIRDAAKADPDRFGPFAERLDRGDKVSTVHKAFTKEKNRPTTKGETLKDARGKDVPARCRDKFASQWLRQTAEEVERIVRDGLKRVLSQVKRTGPEFKYFVAGEALTIVQGMVKDGERLAHLLLEARAYAVCPVCSGKGCKDCRTEGLVPQWRFKEMQAEGIA